MVVVVVAYGSVISLDSNTVVTVVLVTVSIEKIVLASVVVYISVFRGAVVVTVMLTYREVVRVTGLGVTVFTGLTVFTRLTVAVDFLVLVCLGILWVDFVP